MTEFKTEIYTSTRIVGDFDISFSVTEQENKTEDHKDMEELNK